MMTASLAPVSRYSQNTRSQRKPSASPARSMPISKLTSPASNVAMALMRGVKLGLSGSKARVRRALMKLAPLRMKS